MKKLIELIKKLLGSKDSSSDSSSSSGFTLIELLIVIAILGILAAGLLLAIDPAEKLRQGADTRVINDVSQTANKIEAWTIQTGAGTPPVPGVYPLTAAAAWAAVGQPTPPNSTYSFTYTPNGPANTFTIWVQSLQSKKYNATPRFLYDSARGKACLGTLATVGC